MTTGIMSDRYGSTGNPSERATQHHATQSRTAAYVASSRRMHNRQDNPSIRSNLASYFISTPRYIVALYFVGGVNRTRDVVIDLRVNKRSTD